MTPTQEKLTIPLAMKKNNILLKVIPLEEVREGLIVLPKAHKMRSYQADVVAVGDEVNEVRAGDHVFFGPYAGTSITYKDKEYTIVCEEDILCVVG